MNQIKRLNKKELKNLGGLGYTKSELVEHVEKLYIRLGAQNLEDLRIKSLNRVPRIKLIGNTDKKLRQEIREKYNLRYIKDFERRKTQYITDLANENFNEIIRIARLNGNMISFNRNGSEVIFHINERNIPILRDLLSGIEIDDINGSDRLIFEEILNDIEDIIGYDENIQDDEDDGVQRRNNPQGGFLPFINTLPIDLSKFGFFHENEDTGKYHEFNCLYYAFKNLGLAEEKLQSLKIEFWQRDISRKNFKEIANLLNIHIRLSPSRDTNIFNYKPKDIINTLEVFNIGCIENHYFSIEPTDYTSFVLKNYEEVKDIKNFENIVGKNIKTGKYERKNNRGLSSKMVLEYVIKNHSKPINKMDLLNTPFHSKINNKITYLNYPENCCKPIVKRKNSEKKKSVLRIFFDFETVPDNKNTGDRINKNTGEIQAEFIHKATTVCAKFNNNTKKWFGFDCGQEFIKYVMSITNYTEIHLIAHNMSFDFNQIARYLPNIELCKIGNRFICSRSYTKNATIICKDSLNFINNKLCNFPKIFGFNENKEKFQHEWVNITNLDEKGYFINEWIDAPEYEINTPIINGKFNIKNYLEYYCEIDVFILQKGYNIFDQWCLQLGIDIDTVYTVSSIAKQYALENDCFEGCFELTGIPQHYINQSMYGGRVCTQSNNMIKRETGKKYINNKVYDIDEDYCQIGTLDANSLYPSACMEIKGFIKGKPKVIGINQLDIDFLNKQDHYIVDILIKKVGKKLKIPLLCIKKESSIEYTNEVENTILTVGKDYLLDLIKFQEIEFQIIRGYYFNEGFNTKIRDTIDDLYTKRQKLKNDVKRDQNGEIILDFDGKPIKWSNPANEIYKLIMNSIYGKCLQRPRDKKLIIKNSRNDMLRYLTRNKNNIEMIEKIDGCDKYIIREYKEINKDFNSVHIGCQILDASKRIMNEVMYIAEELDFDIYYTDTDSLHLDVCYINKIAEIYKKRYNKILIHNGLGGFKPDFGTNEKTGEYLYAVKSIFLGKKMYIDVLDNGHEHIRLKGISPSAIEYKCNNEHITSWDIFNNRYHGQKQLFDLTCGGGAFTAKQKNNFTFVNINNFTRVV